MLPLFPVSSVTGAGIAPLHAFLRLLQPVTASASVGSSPAAAGLDGARDEPKLHFQVCAWAGPGSVYVVVHLGP